MPLTNHIGNQSGIHLLFVLLIIFSALPTAQANSPETLKLFIWQEYMDPDVVKEFETKFNASIQLNYFNSDSVRDTQLAENGGRGYDLIIVNALQLDNYIKRGWLEPVDHTLVPNSQHIEKKWSQVSDHSENYGVVYSKGTQGIFFNKANYPEGVESWAGLMSPDDNLAGKISMSGDIRFMMAIALKALGHSANEEDPRYIKQASDLLLAQKPDVKQYFYPSLEEFVSGAVWAGTLSNGFGQKLKELNSDYEFVFPKEGGIYWVDFLTVAKSSDKKELAFKFMNFLNEPSIASRQSAYMGYATPNTAARDLLPKSILSNPVLYPDEKTQQYSEFMNQFSVPTLKYINTFKVQLTLQ